MSPFFRAIVEFSCDVLILFLFFYRWDFHSISRLKTQVITLTDNTQHIISYPQTFMYRYIEFGTKIEHKRQRKTEINKTFILEHKHVYIFLQTANIFLYNLRRNRRQVDIHLQRWPCQVDDGRFLAERYHRRFISRGGGPWHRCDPSVIYGSLCGPPAHLGHV